MKNIKRVILTLVVLNVSVGFLRRANANQDVMNCLTKTQEFTYPEYRLAKVGSDRSQDYLDLAARETAGKPGVLPSSIVCEFRKRIAGQVGKATAMPVCKAWTEIVPEITARGGVFDLELSLEEELPPATMTRIGRGTTFFAQETVLAALNDAKAEAKGDLTSSQWKYGENFGTLLDEVQWLRQDCRDANDGSTAKQYKCTVAGRFTLVNANSVVRNKRVYAGVKDHMTKKYPRLSCGIEIMNITGEGKHPVATVILSSCSSQGGDNANEFRCDLLRACHASGQLSRQAYDDGKATYYCR
jgi:hypothetical protein